MRFLGVIILAAFLSGCSKAPPTLAGGKPVTYWVQASTNTDPGLRKKAVFKLGNVGPTDAAVFPVLVGALKDTDARVRCEAILALMKHGPDARKAIPTLTALRQHDRDVQVRAFAAKALARLQSANSG
jgi:HEAT repeat protein